MPLMTVPERSFQALGIAPYYMGSLKNITSTLSLRGHDPQEKSVDRGVLRRQTDRPLVALRGETGRQIYAS